MLLCTQPAPGDEGLGNWLIFVDNDGYRENWCFPNHLFSGMWRQRAEVAGGDNGYSGDGAARCGVQRVKITVRGTEPTQRE